MCKLGRLQMSQRLAACGNRAAGAVHTTTARHRASHACGALQQHQQHPQHAWRALQQAQAALHNSCHQCSAAVVQQRRQAAVPHLPGLLLGGARSSSSGSGSRSYSRSWRHNAAARDSDTEPEYPAAVKTIDKQQLQAGYQQDDVVGSSSNSSNQQQQQQGSPLSSTETSVDAANDSTMIMQPSTKPMYSPLHYDILEFVRQVTPTPAERAEKQRVIQCVAAATKRSFEGTSGIRVQPFGSFVNGLSTWNSDVDLVVTGLAKPSRITGGFSQNDKRLVYRALERIASNLRKQKKVSIRKMIIIRTARIPIIKLETTSRVVADISLGDNSGPQAANYIAQRVAEYPPLAPLVLVLKVYLRSCGLNEVANGGISSFSLTNMALAHLMDELRDGHDVFDLGETLYGFLVRFGDEFDIHQDAVSVSLGGCVRRSELSHLGGDAAGQPRLILEDPLTGRDVASGSYRIVAVQMAFSKAARRLEALAQSHRSSSGTHINYLEGLFDVARALDRSGSKRGSWGPGAANTGLVDEYFVIGQGGRFSDLSQDEQIELPLEGDDFDDDFESYLDSLYSEDRLSRGRRRKSS